MCPYEKSLEAYLMILVLLNILMKRLIVLEQHSQYSPWYDFLWLLFPADLSLVDEIEDIKKKV